MEITAQSIYPLVENERPSRNHVFLRNIITNKNIVVGEYTMYHDMVDPHQFEKINAGYFLEGGPNKLIVGKYCSIAHGAMFLSSVTNHKMEGISYFPFAPIWGSKAGSSYEHVEKGDIVIGNDVWIGFGATIMPGVTIGNGAVIGANAVVTKEVKPYQIIAGNPGEPIRFRFSDSEIEQLETIAWWDWPHEAVVENSEAIMSRDIEKLAQIKDAISA